MSRWIELEVVNPSGLHARPLAAFVGAAKAFRSAVRVRNLTNGGAEANGKSVTGLLLLGTVNGHRIRIEADGEDEDVAIEALGALVRTGLGERSGG